MYKCTSVDANTQTWTGRKAELIDGQYVLQAAETTGLSFAHGLNVKKGKVYSTDGKIHVPRAYNHCLCIAPFRYTEVPIYGDCTISTYHQCYIEPDPDSESLDNYGSYLFFNTSGGKNLHEAYFKLDNLPRLNAFTFEFWMCHTHDSQNSDEVQIFLVNTETDNKITLPEPSPIPINSWHHLAFVRAADSGKVKVYLDGQYLTECTFSDIIGGDYGVRIGLNMSGSKMQNFMFYDFEKYTTNFTPSRQLAIPEWEDVQTLIISGAGIEEANGVYTLVTPNASGLDRIWAKEQSSYCIYHDGEWYCWVISNESGHCYSGYETGDPWNGEWGDATDDESGGDAPTITLIN